MKLLNNGTQTRQNYLQASKIMNEMVGATFSPKGRNIAIQRLWGAPLIHHDGVGVAREIRSTDKFIDMCLLTLREAAQKQVDQCGDGTTLVTLLTHAILSEGVELVDGDTKKNPMVLRRELKSCSDKIIDYLKSVTNPIAGDEELLKIATISAGDEELGKLVADASKAVGETGIVHIEESPNGENHMIFTEGMSFDGGYTHNYFLTNPDRNEAVVENPYVLIFGKKISGQSEIVPILEKFIKEHKTFAIFGDIQGPALEFLIKNKVGGVMNCLVVDPKGSAKERRGILEDIAFTTGGRVFDDFSPDSFNMSYVGRCGVVKSNDKTTKVVDAQKSKEEIAEYVASLQSQMISEQNQFIREFIQARIAKLTTGVAVVYYAAKTKASLKEIRERLDDAIGATRSAYKLGYVPGGAVTLLKAAKHIKDEATVGADLLRSALEAPIRRLLENAGEEQVEFTIDQLESSDRNMGYDVMSNTICNVVERGIIDPTYVLVCAIENSVDVASLILTIDGSIAYAEEKEDRTLDE